MTLRTSAALLAAVVLLPLGASATVVLNETFEQLAANSQLIVRGKAGQSTVRWNDEKTRIQTWTDITVGEVIKGRVSGPVTIRQVGGVIGDIGMGAAGEVSFKQGEEVLLFLEHPGDDQNIYVTRSMSFGKVTLETTALGELKAFRDAKGLGLYEPSNAEIKLLNSREDLGNAASFIARIKRAVSRKAGR